VANPVFRVPGVYLQNKVVRAAPPLPTGVPAFVGFATDDADPGALLGPVALYRKSDFSWNAAKYLGQAVTGFFDNGGAYCYVVGVPGSPDTLGVSAALINALTLLEPLADVDLIAVPDAVALRLPGVGQAEGSVDEASICEVQRAMIRHCAVLDTRVALLDSFPAQVQDQTQPDQGAQHLIDAQLQSLGVFGTGAVNAALYHPWILTATSESKVVPPCGHIAGIISRTDANTGVFKAPANTEILGALDLDVSLGVVALGLLNDAGINCLRAFPARGIRVWGARTLSTDPDWRFLNVRRLVLTIIRWIDANMQWAAFEPNVPVLWARIERELRTYLLSLWRAGALQGESDSEAFFVRSNAELNPPDAREAGQVITEIGLAPTQPAEFIVVTVQHRAGTTELL
jgi:phage tail sheath protein FI